MPEQLSLFEDAEPLRWLEYLGQLKPLPCRSLPKFGHKKLADRLLGMLLGQCAGAALGQPLVGKSPRQIRRKYKRISNYLESPWQTPAVPLTWSLLFLQTAKEHPEGFDALQLAKAADALLPADFSWQARKRLAQGLSPPASGLATEASGEHCFALASAPALGVLDFASPLEAAHSGLEHATLVATGAGLHLAAWVAALTSTALCEQHYRWLFEIALAHVPAHTRLAKVVRQVMRLHDSGYTYRQCLDALGELFKLPPDHRGKAKEPFQNQQPLSALPNAGVVAAALLYGEGDFTKTLSVAAEGGLQADLNCSAAGACVGARLGAVALPKTWLDPLGRDFPSGFADGRTFKLVEIEALCAEVARMLLDRRREKKPEQP